MKRTKQKCEKNILNMDLVWNNTQNSHERENMDGKTTTKPGMVLTKIEKYE